MTELLIVENDLESAHAIRELAKQLGHTAVVAQSAQHALDFFDRRSFSVVLVDRALADDGCHTLLKSLLNRTGDTRAIVMGSQISASDHKWAVSMGALDTLTKPLRASEFEAALRKAMDSGEGVPAQIHGLSLTDIIQAFGMAKRSVTVKAGSGGFIYMRNGEIIHAVDGPRTGVDALKSVLFNKIPSLETGPLEPCEETIEQSLDSLLLDVMVEKDTSSRDLGLGEVDEAETLIRDEDIGFDLVADEANDTTPPRASQPPEDDRGFAPLAFDDATLAHTSDAELGATQSSPTKRPAWVPIAVATAALAIAASLGLGFLIVRSGPAPAPALAPAPAQTKSTAPNLAAQPTPATPPGHPMPTSQAATPSKTETPSEAEAPSAETMPKQTPPATAVQEANARGTAENQQNTEAASSAADDTVADSATDSRTNPKHAQPTRNGEARKRTKRRLGKRARPTQPAEPSSIRSKLKSNPYD